MVWPLVAQEHIEFIEQPGIDEAEAIEKRVVFQCVFEAGAPRVFARGIGDGRPGVARAKLHHAHEGNQWDLSELQVQDFIATQDKGQFGVRFQGDGRRVLQDTR